MSLSLSVPVVGQPNSTESPKIAADFTAIQTWANALPDPLELPTAVGISNPTRVVGTPYQPNTTRPTFVTVSAVGGGAGTNTAVLKIGASSPPTTIAAGVTLTTAAGQVPMTVIVPTSWWYEVVLTSGSMTIPQVIEITL